MQRIIILLRIRGEFRLSKYCYKFFFFRNMVICRVINILISRVIDMLKYLLQRPCRRKRHGLDACAKVGKL